MEINHAKPTSHSRACRKSGVLCARTKDDVLEWMGSRVSSREELMGNPREDKLDCYGTTTGFIYILRVLLTKLLRSVEE